MIYTSWWTNILSGVNFWEHEMRDHRAKYCDRRAAPGGRNWVARRFSRTSCPRNIHHWVYTIDTSLHLAVYLQRYLSFINVDFFLCVNKRGKIFLFAKSKILRISPLLSFVRLFRVDILTYCTGWFICPKTWVGLTLIWVYPHLAQPLLPNSNQPRQNWADSGSPKIQVNPTQVLGQMNHPVHHGSGWQFNRIKFIA